jgi:hypothetical protein
MVGTLTLAMWTIVIGLMVGGVASAQTPSALVLETRGVNLPHLPPYSEVPAGTTVSLPKGGKFVFLHYPTCRTVAVIGGTLTFAEDTYTLKGGTTEAETRSPCPRTVKLSNEYNVGGVLMRGERRDGMLTLSPYPTFVLVGRRAGDFAAVRVSQGGQEVLTAALDGQRFLWPSQALPLSEDGTYELALVPRHPGADSVTKQFKVLASIPQSPSGTLTLLKIE